MFEVLEFAAWRVLYHCSIDQGVLGGGEGRHGGHRVVRQRMGAADHRVGGWVLPLLLLAFLLLQQGGEVQSRSLQLTVGPPCHHMTLRMSQKKHTAQTQKRTCTPINTLSENSTSIRVCAVVFNVSRFT